MTEGGPHDQGLVSLGTSLGIVNEARQKSWGYQDCCNYEAEVIHGVVPRLAWCQVLLGCRADVLVYSVLL